MFNRFDDIFRTFGWRVLTLKYGKAQLKAFAKPGGEHLKAWIDACSNVDYAALTYQGGAAWRRRLAADIGELPGVRALLEAYDDTTLNALMLDLGAAAVMGLTLGELEGDG